MKNQESLLGKLLNDESFIRWLEGNASHGGKEEWNRWLSKNPNHQVVIEKARKILNMPFKTIPVDICLQQELNRLKKNISDSKKATKRKG